MEKRTFEDLEEYNNKVKLDQAKERLRIDTLMKEEVFQTRCNDEIAIAIREEEEMIDDYENDGILRTLSTDGDLNSRNPPSITP